MSEELFTLPAPPPKDTGHIRCISLWQPWATLIAIGAKNFETRGWSTAFRGPLVIHAAKRTSEIDACFQPFYREALIKAGITKPRDLPFGGYVAVCEMAGVFRTEEIINSLSEEERAFGNYEPGRFAWKLENITAIQFKASPGRQGFWTAPKWEVGL